jgi:branched-chain amino acid transport system substrate-binding protein
MIVPGVRRQVAVLLVVLGIAAAGPAPAAERVKIGFIATFSGPVGLLGQHGYDGFMLGVEHAGGKLGGLATEILKEDDQLKPDIGLQVAKKLLEKDRVDFVVGTTFSNVMMAIYRPVVDAKTFLISHNAGPSPLAGAQCSPFFFSASWQNDGPHEAMGKHVQDQGYKRVYLMAPNYQAGKDALAGFKRYFKGEVAGEVYTALNQPDYSAELTQLRAARPDALYVFYPGGMGVNFVKQYAQAGLLKEVPFFSAFTVDETTLKAQGDAAVGTYGTAFWNTGLKVAASERFVADFEKKYGYTPSTYAAQAYDAALLLDSGVRGVKGNLDDKDALRAALRKADFASVRGPFKYNTNQFPIESFYLHQVVKDASGRLKLENRGVVLAAHADAYARECPMK